MKTLQSGRTPGYKSFTRHLKNPVPAFRQTGGHSVLFPSRRSLDSMSSFSLDYSKDCRVAHGNVGHVFSWPKSAPKHVILSHTFFGCDRKMDLVHKFGYTM
jgi:hypothetical protein